MDQNKFKETLNKVHADIKSGKYDNSGLSPQELSAALVVGQGLRNEQRPISGNPANATYTRIFEPDFIFNQRGVRLPTYRDLTDPQKRAYYNNYALNKMQNPDRETLSPLELLQQNAAQRRQNWAGYLEMQEPEERVDLLGNSLGQIQNEINTAQNLVDRFSDEYDKLHAEAVAQNRSNGRFAGMVNQLREQAGVTLQDEFDWESYQNAGRAKAEAKDYLSALEALRENRETEAVTDAYRDIESDEQIAAIKAALAEVRNQKSAGVIAGRAGTGARENYLQNREDLNRQERVLEEALRKFQGDKYTADQTELRQKLENQALAYTDYQTKLQEIEDQYTTRALPGAASDTQVIGLINLTPQELAIYTTLKEHDPDAAAEYKDTIERDINARRAAFEEEDIRNSGWFVNLLRYIGGGFSSIGSNFANLLSSAQEIITDEYVPPDLNSEAYWGPRTRQTVMETFDEDIDNPLISTIVQVGLSLTDMAVASPLGMGAAFLKGFSNNRADIAFDALERGATFQEAWISGVAGGLAETLVEMIPFGKLFRMASTGGKIFSKAGIGNILKAAGMEAGEETISQYLGTLADMKIMGGRSQFSQTMQEYIANGMSEGEAYRATLEDYFVYQPMLAAFGGAVGGAFFGTGAQGVGNLRRYFNEHNSASREAMNQEAAEVVRARAGVPKGIREAQDQAANGTSLSDNNIINANNAIMATGNDIADLDNMNTVEAAGGQPQPITQADRERANQLMEREMAAEQAEEEALSPDNFLTGELAERAAGTETGSTTDSADTGYDIGEEIGDVGFGEGAIDNLPEQDLAERFRNKQQSGQMVTAPNESAKLKMLRNQLRNKGIRDVRVEDLPDGERGYYDPVTNEIVVSSKLTDEEAFNFAMGHEVVHHAVRADEDLVDDVISSMRADGIDVDARIAAVIARYRRHAAARGEDPSRIDERYAMEEVVADYIGEICRNDRYLQQLASDQPNLLVRIIRMLEDLLANLGHSREEINKAREYEATISRVQDALAKAGHEEMIEGERRYSIKRTRTMPYKEQVEGYFNNNGYIRSSDSLYLGDSDPTLSKYGIESSPLYIPTSVINKAIRSIKGSKSGHNLTKSDILELQDGIKNAVAIVYNPSRNALIYVTENQDTEGNYIIATFDLNNDLYGENAHKATSIHGRENLAMMLERLGEDATVFVQNENKLNQMLPGNQILKSLELLAKVELDSASIPGNDTEVNRRYSLEEENDPDLQRAIEMQQEGYSPTDISNATGKVVMANGDIYSGIGGVLQYSPNREQGGDIGGRREQEAGRERAYQGRADNQDEAGQGLGEVARTTRNDDRRRNRADGGRVREEARDWEELSENERQGFAQIAKQYLQAEPGSELEIMLNAYGASDNDTYIDIAEEIYNDLAIHPALVKDRWANFVPDIQALISDFEAAMEDTGRRYSLEEDSEGDGRRYSLTEEATNQQEQQNPRTMSKAERYLNRQINAAVQKIADILSIPNSSRRNELKPLLQKLADEYKANGRISNESINEVFNQAYDMGLVIQDDFYNEYRDLKNILRDSKITISPEDAANIGDYSLWRRRQFGKLRIVNNGGEPIDSFYSELAGMYPELFDPDLTAPSEQLQRIAEVADQINVVEQTLDDAYGDDAENFKIFARQEFRNEIDDFIDELAIVSRYEQEKAERKSAAEQPSAPRSEATMAKVYKEFKAARRKVDKAVAKYLLTDADNQAIEGLLKGFYTPDNLPDGINKKAVLEVYNAKRAYEELAAIIDENNKAIKNARLAIIEELLETSDDWTDKKTGFAYSRETMERNIRDIVPDKKVAKRIIDELFTPVHANEASRTRLKNDYRDRVRKLNISRKVAKGNKVSEAYAVQFLGEANSAIAYLQDKRPDLREGGLTYDEWQTARNEFLAENPNLDMPKIEQAIEEFRAIYDELFQMVNQARLRNGYPPVDYRRGYFPHFTETGSDTIFGKMAQALGINMDVTDLPTDINGLTHTFRPGIRWEGHLLQRLGNETTYDALQGFDKYIEGVSDIIFHTDDIQRLRAFASAIRYKYSREGIRAKVDEIRESNLSPEEKESLIAEAWGTDRTALSNLVVEIEEYTNLLANKKAFDDRNMERKINRKIYNIVKGLENRVAANMIAINPGSWLTNFIPLAQGAATLKNGALLRGMWDTIRSYKTDDGFWQASDFLTNRRGSELLSLTAVQKAGRIAGKGMDLIDQFTADSLVRARYYQNMQEGLSQAEALAEADAWAASVIADRSKGALPTFFEAKNPFRKLFTMFQVEVNNQLSFLFKDLPAEARRRGVAAVALALLKYALAAYIFDDLYELLVGRRPALDPLNMLNEAVGDLTGYELPNTFSLLSDAVSGNEIDFTTEQEGLSEAGLNLIENVGENIPFVGGVFFDGGRIPISSALPNIENIWKAGSGLITGEMNDDKAWASIGKELMAPAVYLVPPFGGGAIKKAVQGIDAVAQSGSYTVDTDGNDILQYPIYNNNTLQTIGNYARAAIFGKTSLPTGANWIAEGFKNLSAKESAAYKELVIGGSNSEDVYETLRAMKAEKKSLDKRLELMDAPLSDYEKLTIYETVLYDEGDSRPEDIENIMATGVSFDDAMRIQNKYSILNDLDDMTASEKSAEFAYWLDSNDFADDQQDVIREAFKFYSMVPTGDTQYDRMTAAGLSDETAYKVSTALSDLVALDGETQVSGNQKYRAIVDSGISEDDQMKAFRAVMNDSQYEKVSVGYNNGVAPGDYVTFREYLDEESEGDNATQAEAVKALNRMTWLSTSEKAVLYQLANSGWVPKNNPYSTTVGAKVYYAMK